MDEGTLSFIWIWTPRRDSEQLLKVVKKFLYVLDVFYLMLDFESVLRMYLFVETSQ